MKAKTELEKVKAEYDALRAQAEKLQDELQTKIQKAMNPPDGVLICAHLYYSKPMFSVFEYNTGINKIFEFEDMTFQVEHGVKVDINSMHRRIQEIVGKKSQRKEAMMKKEKKQWVLVGKLKNRYILKNEHTKELLETKSLDKAIDLVGNFKGDNEEV